jgi:hypothetical protein
MSEPWAIGPHDLIKSGTTVAILWKTDAHLPAASVLEHAAEPFGAAMPFPTGPAAPAWTSLLAMTGGGVTGAIGAIGALISGDSPSPELAPRILLTVDRDTAAGDVYAAENAAAGAPCAIAGLPAELSAGVESWRKTVGDLREAETMANAGVEQIKEIAKAATDLGSAASHVGSYLPWIVGGLIFGGLVVVAGAAWYVAHHKG